MKNKIENKIEAINWLKNNKNESAFANFEETKDALKFVRKLYKLGAIKVEIDPASIDEDPWRIEEEGGPYADGFFIFLPKGGYKRLELQSLLFEETPGEILPVKKGKTVNGKVNWAKDDVICVWWD